MQKSKGTESDCSEVCVRGEMKPTAQESPFKENHRTEVE